MPTNHKYPFATGEDIKKAASQINLNIEIANLATSLQNAATQLAEIISPEVYKRMIDHYNSGSFSETGQTTNDQLVQLCRTPLANLGLYDHFIWLQLNISNSGITVVKGTNETAAYKYMTDEAKDQLLESGWRSITTLIDFMTADDTEIAEWDESDQRKAQKSLIFKDYREFNQYFGIDGNAAFYVRCRYLIAEIIAADIKPRVKRLDTIVDDVQLIKIKRYLAYRTIEMAISRFDVLNLPQSLRRSTTNERSNKADDQNTIKEKLRLQIARRADQYLIELDTYTAGKAAETTETDEPYSDYETNMDVSQKYFNAL